MNTVAPQAAATAGEESGGENRAAMAVVAEKPLFIFVVADDATNAEMRKLEDVIFKNEDVAVGAKFFECVKVTAADAGRDRILQTTGEATPRLVFLTRDYKVQSTFGPNQLSAGKIKKSMGSLAASVYEMSFDKVLSEYKKLLNELDRLDSVRKNLETQKAKLAADPSKSEQKKLERDEKEYQEGMASWEQQERKLLTFTRKGEKPAAA